MIFESHVSGRGLSLRTCTIENLTVFYAEEALEMSRASITKWCGVPECYIDVEVKSLDVEDIKLKEQIGTVTISKTEDFLYKCNGVVDPSKSRFDDFYMAEFEVKKIDGNWLITNWMVIE